MGEDEPETALMDAGLFIGALLRGDPRHDEARSLVEDARRGHLKACTTAGILSEVYGTLTWECAEPRQTPAEAAQAVRLLVESPSAIGVLPEGREVALLTCRLAAQYGLTARLASRRNHGQMYRQFGPSWFSAASQNPGQHARLRG